MTQKLLQVCSEVIVLNECPIKTDWPRLKIASIGDSGFSFGPQQIDCSKNGLGAVILRKIGVDEKDIQSICAFSRIKNPVMPDKGVVSRVEKLLKANVDLLEDEFDKYVNSKLTEILSYPSVRKLPNTEHAIVVMFVDMEVQFNLNKGGMIDQWLLRTYTDSISPEELCQKFLAEKLSTKWGRSQPNDVFRRYDNAVRVLKAHDMLDKGYVNKLRMVSGQSTVIKIDTSGKSPDKDFIKNLYGV